MKNIFKRYAIVIVLGFLLLILIIVKLFFGGKKEEIDTTPTPVAVPTIITNEVVGDEGEAPGAITYMPYEGKKMIITGFIKPGFIEVLIKSENDRKEAEKEVEEWNEKFGKELGNNTFIYKVVDSW